jgi:hypothetical protein
MRTLRSEIGRVHHSIEEDETNFGFAGCIQKHASSV